MHDNFQYTSLLPWFCENCVVTTCLTPGGRSYVLELKQDAPRTNLSEILTETTMYGAIRYTNDSVSGWKHRPGPGDYSINHTLPSEYPLLLIADDLSHKWSKIRKKS